MKNFNQQIDLLRERFAKDPGKVGEEFSAFMERKFNHLAVIGNVELRHKAIIARNEEFDSYDSFIKTINSKYNGIKQTVNIYQFAQDNELPNKNFVKDNFPYQSYLCKVTEDVNCYSTTQVIKSAKRKYLYNFQKALTFTKKIIDYNLIEAGNELFIFLQKEDKNTSVCSFILVKHFPNLDWEIDFYGNNGIMNENIKPNQFILYE